MDQLKPKNRAIVLINAHNHVLTLDNFKSVEDMRKTAIDLAIICQESRIEILKEYGTVNDYENAVLKELICFK